jgi:hypothetical protein
MRFRGARDNTFAWIIGLIVIAVIAAAAIWLLFIDPI